MFLAGPFAVPGLYADWRAYFTARLKSIHVTSLERHLHGLSNHNEGYTRQGKLIKLRVVSRSNSRSHSRPGSARKQHQSALAASARRNYIYFLFELFRTITAASGWSCQCWDGYDFAFSTQPVGGYLCRLTETCFMTRQLSPCTVCFKRIALKNT